MREGKLDDALALYRKTLQTSPLSVPANIAAGSVLDLMGATKWGSAFHLGYMGYKKSFQLIQRKPRK